MWIDRLTASPTMHALELSAQFAEQRQKVLAENLANIDTPNYQTQQLDPEAFQTSLRKALTRAQQDGASRLELRGDAQIATTADGQMAVQPSRSPADNVLFHDGTNVRLEKLLTQTSENSLSYELSLNLLRSKIQTLLRAIRGRTE